MNDGKRYVFYDVLSGEKIVTEARNRDAIMPTVQRVIEIYPELFERDPSTYDVIILKYDDYAEDFTVASSYRVNPETKELEFSYPDPNAPEIEQPYIPPLSEEVKLAKSDAEMALFALTDVYEKQIADNSKREEDAVTSMMGLTEAYELIMQQQAVIDDLQSRLTNLEGAE